MRAIWYPNTVIYNKWNRRTLGESLCSHLKGIAIFSISCDWLVSVGEPLRTLEEEDRTRKEVSDVVRTNTKCLRKTIQCLVCTCTRNALRFSGFCCNEEQDQVVAKCWKRAEGILCSGFKIMNIWKFYTLSLLSECGWEDLFGVLEKKMTVKNFVNTSTQKWLRNNLPLISSQVAVKQSHKAQICTRLQTVTLISKKELVTQNTHTRLWF